MSALRTNTREERKLGETFAGPMASNPQECGTKPGGDLVPLFWVRRLGKCQGDDAPHGGRASISQF